MEESIVQPKTTKKILIVEDEGEMCLLLNILLNDEEMEIDHVKDLASAAEYLEGNKPSLIILDNKLPDGFGIDYISSLKNSCPGTRIIMISGYDASARDVALENGADFFLAKPFKKADLFDSIKSMLYQSVG